MGTWNLDAKSRPGILIMKLDGIFSEEEMRAFVIAHNRAIDEFAGAEYRVFCDLRGLHTLKPECAAILQTGKEYSSAHKNFQGSAVWVASALIALQHRRTSVEGGVMDTELISEDEAALWAHLAKVKRA